MNRNPILSYLNNNDFVFENNKENFVFYSSKNTDLKKINIVVKEDAFLNILFLDVLEELDVELTLNKNSSVTVECLFDREVKNIKIHANLDEFASINGYFADFSLKNVHAVVDVNLNKIKGSLLRTFFVKSF